MPFARAFPLPLPFPLKERANLFLDLPLPLVLPRPLLLPLPLFLPLPSPLALEPLPALRCQAAISFLRRVTSEVSEGDLDGSAGFPFLVVDGGW